MKKVLVLMLVMIVLLQGSIKSVYVAYFNFNQDYIASVLCINKAKPASICQGKCYLAKKMKAQEAQEQTIPSVLKGLEEVLLYFSNFDFNPPPIIFEDTQLALLDGYELARYQSPVNSIIQPPQ